MGRIYSLTSDRIRATLVTMEQLREFSFRWKGEPSGVYMLLWRGQVVYVGQSIQMWARVNSHWNNLVRVRKGKRPYGNNLTAALQIEFDEVKLVYCPKQNLDAMEQSLIQKYLPKHNTNLKREPAPSEMAKSEVMLELFKKRMGDKGPEKYSYDRAQRYRRPINV